MSVFSRLTRRTLIKNKTRTAVTIVGVMLSAAMFTAVTAMVSSTRGFLINITTENTGDWHGVYYSAPASSVAALVDTGEVKAEAVMPAQVLGYAAAEGITRESKPYIYVLGVKDNFFGEMSITLTDGRLPENPGEIILPEHLAQTGGLEIETGETLTLDLGERWADAVDTPLVQTKPLLEDEAGERAEKLRIKETRTYTVVGHYKRPGFELYSAPGYTALTAADADAGAYRFDTYFRVVHPSKGFDFISKYRELGLDWESNSTLLMLYGSSAYSGFNTVLYGFAAILIILIMFGSVSLIYNAFSISVADRTKQFGLLSSVGATRRQLRSGVLHEGMLIAAIGIPLGLILGLLGIGVTLRLLGGVIRNLLGGAADAAFSLTVSAPALIISAAVALITVFISVQIPARRAMKISAIDAIRQSGDVSIGKREARAGKITQKLFGLEGALAAKNFKRNRKSYRATVVSLFMSVVLFISASSFSFYLSRSVSGSFNNENYDISVDLYSVPVGYPGGADAVFALLSGADGIDWASRRDFLSGNPYLEESEFSEQMISMSRIYGFTLTVNISISVISDEAYRSYLTENRLDAEKYMDAENPVFIAYDNFRLFSEGKIENFPVLREHKPRDIGVALQKWVEFNNAVASGEVDPMTDHPVPTVDKTLAIAAFAENVPPGAVRDVGVSLFISEGCARALLGDVLEQCVTHTSFYFGAQDHAIAAASMEKLLSENGLSGVYVSDTAAREEASRGIVAIINVFSYGFIILISLISAANVFNTISTNINLRRREFAMLKSVGMTRAGFSRMMTYECVLYGAKALLYGLPVAALATYGIFNSAVSGFGQTFVLPPVPFLIAILSVFLVVFATTLYSMRRIRGENPIDALKLEIT
jgi:putative ABC transport system permease protein